MKNASKKSSTKRKIVQRDFKKEVKRLKTQKSPDRNSDGIAVTVRVHVCPKYLLNHSNVLNWKDHPKRQLEYLADQITNNVGWAGAALYCANTDRMLDGHGRAIMSANENLSSMPCDIGWYTKEQGDEILASLDPSGQMSSVDGNALKSLTEAVLSKRKSGKKDSPILSMFADVHGYAKRIAEEKKDRINIQKSRRSLSKILTGKKSTTPNEKESGSNVSDGLYETIAKDDLIFPSKGNTFGIPDLLESKL